MMLIAMIDPVSKLLIFSSLTSELSPQQRRKTALKATIFSGIILIGALVIGQILLSALGIQLISFQVAGGIILFLFGLQMVFKNSTHNSFARSESDHDMAIFPLAVPSIAGPGSIMAVILLTNSNLYSTPEQIVTTIILIFVLVLTFVFMLAAEPILLVIGKNGAAILTRVLGMILVALSVELVLEALRIPGWIKSGL